VQFTPDGIAVAYPIRENGIDNLWVHPLDGSAGHQMTHFNSDEIESFHWSPDGKSLALLRSHRNADVVLLQEAKRNTVRKCIPILKQAKAEYAKLQ